MSTELNLSEFLNNLFKTNTEFAANFDELFFDSFRDDQTPKATVLKCSDSRVQMESFDKTPQNGIFAIRNIGNQISSCEGSIDFGIRVLKTPFLLILGHSACGAIEAVLSGKSTTYPAIDKELSSLKISNKDVKLAIIENVDNQVNFALKKYHDLIKQHKLTIIGAIYDFRNDFGFGKGKLVTLSINGETDRQKIDNKILAKVKHLNFLNQPR